MTDEQLKGVLKCVQERDEWKAKAEAAIARAEHAERKLDEAIAALKAVAEAITHNSTGGEK